MGLYLSSVNCEIPKPRVGKKSRVFCGGYPIFKGILPEAQKDTKNSGKINEQDLENLEFLFD